MAKLSTLQLLRLFKKARELSDVPDIHDGTACRQWLRKLIVVLYEVAPSTETPVDDEAVVLLDMVAESDEAWAQAYRLLFLIITHESLPGEKARAVVQVAAETGCDKETAVETMNALSTLFTP